MITFTNPSTSKIDITSRAIQKPHQHQFNSVKTKPTHIPRTTISIPDKFRSIHTRNYAMNSRQYKQAKVTKVHKEIHARNERNRIIKKIMKMQKKTDFKNRKNYNRKQYENDVKNMDGHKKRIKNRKKDPNRRYKHFN